MAYELKSENGEVEVTKKAGSAFVKFKMPEGKARGIIETGKAEKSDRFPGFGICVDDCYFAGSMTVSKPEKPAEEKKIDEPKPERNNFGKSDKKYFGKKRH